MTDTERVLRAALRERGITTPEQFQERYGVPLHHLTLDKAYQIVTTPAWVTTIWIPNAGSTPVVWVPAAVRNYGAIFGIVQADDENDHDFTLRLRAAMQNETVPSVTRG
jgi:hypothetical protein